MSDCSVLTFCTRSIRVCCTRFENTPRRIDRRWDVTRYSVAMRRTRRDGDTSRRDPALIATRNLDDGGAAISAMIIGTTMPRRSRSGRRKRPATTGVALEDDALPG